MKKRLKDVWKPMLFVAALFILGGVSAKWEASAALHGGNVPDFVSLFSTGYVFS